MVIVYDYMPAIHVGMKLLEAEAHQQTILLNVSIVNHNVSKCFTGKHYGLPALYQGSP